MELTTSTNSTIESKSRQLDLCGKVSWWEWCREGEKIVADAELIWKSPVYSTTNFAFFFVPRNAVISRCRATMARICPILWICRLIKWPNQVVRIFIFPSNEINGLMNPTGLSLRNICCRSSIKLSARCSKANVSFFKWGKQHQLSSLVHGYRPWEDRSDGLSKSHGYTAHVI